MVSTLYRLTTVDRIGMMAQPENLTGTITSANCSRDCPACRSSLSRSLGEKYGYVHLTCVACGTVYLSTLPTNQSRMHYEAGYYDDENPTVPDFISRRLEEIVASFSLYRLNNRLLDVGCGLGSLLKVAKSANWDAHGVEVSLPTVEHLGNSGLKVFPGELADAAFPSDHFDVVTAAELIEHVPDPSALVAEVARVLRPGGIFWATTPHARGASARVLKLKSSVICPPEHLHLFSIKGLRDLLVRNGFRRVVVKTEGLNASELLGRFITREQRGAISDNESHKRVKSNYRLNEELLKNPRRRVLKQAATALLRASRLGDALKVWAER